MTHQTINHCKIARYGACLALTFAASWAASGTALAHHNLPHAVHQDAREVQEGAQRTIKEASGTARRAGRSTRRAANNAAASTRRRAQQRTNSAFGTARCAATARNGDPRRATMRAERCIRRDCRMSAVAKDRRTSPAAVSVRPCIQRPTTGSSAR